jgi:hypothetical protein
LRSLSVAFKNEIISFFDLQFPKVVDVIQTSVPLIEVKSRGMDANFLLEDSTILHLEFESTVLTEDDLVRFGHYDLELYRQRKQKIRRVVIFTPEVKESLAGLDIGSVLQKHRVVYLEKDYDGDAIFAEVARKLEQEEPLKGKDKLHIILLPMMKSSTTGRSHRALELTRMLGQKSKDELGYYLIGAMVAANYGWIEEPEKQLIMEVLKMAQPFQDLYQEFEAKGMEKEKMEVAKKMLLKNMDVGVIAEITELSVEKIERLKTNPN